MSRYGVWAKITIGGALPRDHMGALIRALQEDGSYDYEETDLEKVSADTSCLYVDDDNNSSEFEATRELCRRHDLYYYFQIDGDANTAPYFEVWQPGMEQPYWRYLHDDVIPVVDLVAAFRQGKTLAEVIAESLPRKCDDNDVPPLTLVDGAVIDVGELVLAGEL